MRYVTIAKFLPAELTKLLFVAALGSAALLFTSSLYGQNCPIQPSPDSVRANGATANNIRGGCGDPGGPGDGGDGGGGGGVPAQSAVLNWNYPTSTNAPQAGGNSQREGVGAAVFQGYLYVAYTGRNVFDSRGDAPVYFTLGPGDGSSITAGYQANLDPGSAQTIASNANPALAATTDSSQPYYLNLFMAINDGYGNTGIVKGTYNQNAPGRVDWNNNIYGYAQGVDGSPSLAFYTNPATGQELLYMAVRNAADHSLTVVAINPTNMSSTSMNCSGCTLGFSPGLGTYQGQLYIGIQANDNSHNIYYWTTTDGRNLSFSAATKADQTSTTPSFATHNGYLYLGFRSNDGDHKFLYKYFNGSTWSGNVPVGSMIMAGNPTLIDGSSLNSSFSPYVGNIINTYVSDDGNYHIFASDAQ